MLNTAPQLPLRLQDDRFLPALASAMQQYRRHILFLPETYFHRNASKLLQMHLNRFEMAFMEKMESGLLWKGGAMQVLSRRSSWQSEYRGSQFHLFNETRRDEIGNRGLLRAVHAEVEREFTPDRHFFRLTVLRFKDADMDVVMDHLGEDCCSCMSGRILMFFAFIATLGLLDQSAPGTVFTIAARVFQHAFSRSSWIAVGHFSDLIGGEVHHLLNPISYFDFETDFGASSLRDRAQGGENSYDQEKAGEVSTE
ncbi:hypothetical protein BC830DRAFT_201529 [Chytriomyces sp. MP71]|nr:hypothetical protein BC830DRAFT_201529 [Chytriomyces sp. MP71]